MAFRHSYALIPDTIANTLVYSRIIDSDNQASDNQPSLRIGTEARFLHTLMARDVPSRHRFQAGLRHGFEPRNEPRPLPSYPQGIPDTHPPNSDSQG